MDNSGIDYCVVYVWDKDSELPLMSPKVAETTNRCVWPFNNKLLDNVMGHHAF